MVLTRSDSSSSAWFNPSTSRIPPEPLERDQRRVRHLHSISIQNLTLDSTLDSLLTRPFTTSLLHDDPTSSLSPSNTLLEKGKGTRARSSSTVSRNSSFFTGEEREGREIVLDSGNSFQSTRTRPRRSSSAGTLLSRALKIKEEGDEDENETELEGGDGSTGPSPGTSLNSLETDSNSFPFPFPTPAEELSTSTSASTASRNRSTSRASLHSNATTTSSVSTIRQAPKLPPYPPLPPSSKEKTRRTPSSSQFAERERKRRQEALRRKLVDSFISIELVEPERTSTSEVPSTDQGIGTGRKRGKTITGTAGVGGIGPRIRRSDSSSSINSTSSTSRKGVLRRRRTVSSNFLPTLSSLSSTAATKKEEEIGRVGDGGGTETSPPFYVSNPAIEQVNPTFYIDQLDFLIPRSAPAAPLGPLPLSAPSETTTTGTSQDSERPIQFPDDERIDSWSGLRESRVRVKVFARRRRSERERDQARKGSNKEKTREKGKGKEVGTAEATRKNGQDEDEEEKGWNELTEWDIDLSSLVSLGRNPSAFPSLPPNTLLFTLLTPSSPFSFSPSTSSTNPSIGATTSTTSLNDLEYFTAPLEILFSSSRQNRQRSSSSVVHRRRRNGFGERQSLSDDEGTGWCSCQECGDFDSSNSEEERDSDQATGGGGNGNLSDPGVSSSSTTRRLRSDSVRFGTRGRKAGTRKRNDSILRERIRIEEDKLKRIELIERSRRETRMVELASIETVERLWVGEQEIEGIRREKREVEGRLVDWIKAGEVGELRRDREEREDRVGDLEGVRESVEDDVKSLVRKLGRRKEALRLRRDRLERVRAMDGRNRQGLRDTTRKADEMQTTIASLQTSISSRRTHIITLLSHLFPIEPVVPSTTYPSPPPLLFSILSLPLPNSTYPPSYSDDLLSSALSHAAHLTQILAAYLSVPLCYPIVWRGSRSVVKDEISMMKGPRAFPLYGKGVDQYRFDYGVFLLNKNIEQLMYSQNLTVLDLRNTLPNLKTLVLSLSYGEWTLDYAKASLQPEGVFAEPDATLVEGEEPGEEQDDPEVGSSRDIGGHEREGESSNSSGSTESTSEPSTTPETSIDSLPPLQESDGISSSSSPTTRSRSSSLASAASTIRQHTRPESPSTSSTSSRETNNTQSRRSSSRESKGPSSTTTPATKRSNRMNGSEGGGTEKRSRTASPSPTTLSSSNTLKTSTTPSSSSEVEVVKVKLEEGKRKRKESYGSRFANSVWSAVAGKTAVDREHVPRGGTNGNKSSANGNGSGNGQGGEREGGLRVEED
ncbi:hypothetical protein JCM16303_006262 [Sporobolomyces ruberrimus]